MDIFAMRDAVLDSYSNYVQSFLKIADSTIRDKVQGEYSTSACSGPMPSCS